MRPSIITPLMGRLCCSTARVCLDLMVAWAHKYISEAIYYNPTYGAFMLQHSEGVSGLDGGLGAQVHQ